MEELRNLKLEYRLLWCTKAMLAGEWLRGLKRELIFRLLL